MKKTYHNKILFNRSKKLELDTIFNIYFTFIDSQFKKLHKDLFAFILFNQMDNFFKAVP